MPPHDVSLDPEPVKLTLLADWTVEVGDWHKRAFPWAKLPHIAEKLDEERHEAVLAWASGNVSATADELADLLICVLAMFAREGINPDLALASKFERVMAKYKAEEPELPF